MLFKNVSKIYFNAAIEYCKDDLSEMIKLYIFVLYSKVFLKTRTAHSLLISWSHVTIKWNK